MGKRNRERRAGKQARADRGRHGPVPGAAFGAAFGGGSGGGRGGANGVPAPDPLGFGDEFVLDDLFGSDQVEEDVFGTCGPAADTPFGPYLRSAGRTSPAETLETMQELLAGVGDDEAAVLVTRWAADLAGGPLGGAAGWPSLSRALLGLAERSVRGAWEAGWQPADLVRLARRELSARHARLAVDLVAAEARRYPAAGLDPRWAGQLDEVAAEVWWTDDGTYADAWAAREGLDRPGVLGYALAVLRLLARMPPIPAVGPLPGAVGSGTSASARSASAGPEPAGSAPDGSGPEPRMLGRIRGLLAKAESTEFPEEAEALTGKAQQLMAQYSISAALLAADAGGEDPPGARRIGIDNPYEAAKALLLDAVAVANRCRTVWSRAFGFATVVGFEPDLDAVELLYTSLLVQATAAMNRAGSRQDARGRSRTRAFRQAFLVAYAGRIRDRLTAATAQATDAAATGGSVGPDAKPDVGPAAGPPADPRLLPVLVARAEAVDDAVAHLFPEMATHAVNAGDREGWAQGTAAADRAVLHARTAVDEPGPDRTVPGRAGGAGGGSA